ncbi:MAG: hypothetical protein KGL59_01645 [Acidobacteriota bacterium]|nr:hypothetical protein [Acidobacteriota bacterium]
MLSRQSDRQPNEYAGKVKLPGAERCTVEVVGGSEMYLCVFPPQTYVKMIEEYDRVVGDVKEAIPSKWVTWEDKGQVRKGGPGPARAFRAGPGRGAPVVEIVTLMPAKKPPHLALVVHRGQTAAAVAN